MLQFQDIDSNWTSQVTSLCFIVSTWDEERWDEYLKAFPDCQYSVDAGEIRMKGWKLFASELFHRLYTVPQAIPCDQLRPEVLWAYQLHQWLDESVDFAEMQSLCKGNVTAAGQGAFQLLNRALYLLPMPPHGFEDPATVEEWEREFVSVQAQIVAREAALPQLQADLQAETDSARQQQLQRQIDQTEYDLNQLRLQLKQIERQIGLVRQEMLDYANSLGQSLADSLAAAIRASLEEVCGFLAALSAFGWGAGMGALEIPGNLALKQAVAQRLTQDDRFRRIADAAGRFKAIAALHQGKQRSKQTPDEVAGTSLGNNLPQLAPSEWARLAIKSMQSLFFKDYADEALVQTEFDGAVEEGQQGPVVICLDKSGSMSERDGKKEVDSTGLMLALLAIAQHQKRSAKVILFDDPVRYEKTINPNSVSNQDLVDLADRRYSGGTNFMAPLQKALAAIESAPDLRNADVIFITDGEADVSDSFSRQWREAQKRLSFKVYTLIVGTYINTSVLDKFSDRNIYVRDLDDPKVHEVFDI